MRDRQDELIVVVKEVIFLFAVLACVGSFYHANFVAGAGYLAVAAVLYNEKHLRGWFRKHFS
jgi:hypothetical protein